MTIPLQIPVEFRIQTSQKRTVEESETNHDDVMLEDRMNFKALDSDHTAFRFSTSKGLQGPFDGGVLGMLCGQSMISLLEPRDTQRILILLLDPAVIDESCFTVFSQDDVSVESENKVNIRRGFS